MMKKDRKWFVDKWTKERNKTDVHDPMYHFINEFIEDVRELDEPEVLSQEWIDEHIDYADVGGDTSVYTCRRLKSLLAPKQEITEEQVMNWLDNNEFYDHITAETVLGRAVDKGELSYYGTKYSVIEAPIIPQFVADWHKQNKYYLLSEKFERIADWEDERVVNWYEKCTGRHSNNLANAQETIALMDLVGYEVEEEPLYYALIKGHELLADEDTWAYSYWNLSIADGRMFPSGRYSTHERYLTEMSQSKWNELGINDSNADFVRVEQNN